MPTIQARLSASEFERLDKIVEWVNAPNDWSERRKRKEKIGFQSYSGVTVSDVVRLAINGDQVTRILTRITKPSRKRNTRTR